MANKGSLSVADFPVAPRRQKPADAAAPVKNGAPDELQQATSTTAEASPTAIPPPAATEQAAPERRSRSAATPGPTRSPRRRSLTPPSEQERRDKIEARTIEQEDGRTRLRDLKRARQRDAKHFVNVPLDYDVKKRLEKAAHDNDLKMTVIMKAAIEQFLEENGY